MNYKGTIIEESLADKSVLKDIRILGTRVEPVTEKHQTPWLKQWTLHTVEISQARADEAAEKISQSLDYSHGSAWYADFKNDQWHYIIFKEKIFKVPRDSEEEYRKVREYGISLGIPSYQVDFSPEIS